MKSKSVFSVFFLLMTITAGFSQVIPFSSDRWNIEAQEHSIETYKGMECLLMKGGIAFLEDVEFLDGTIEFDLSIPDARGFMGAVWRLQDAMNYEEFYVRSHQSGNPDACQYTPVFNGVAGWQLYYGEGHGAVLTYPFNEWMHVKILVSGDWGEVYVMDMEKPAVIIHDMKMETIEGKIGVKVNAFSPGRLANFQYSTEKPELSAPPVEGQISEPFMITSWQVSDPFMEDMVSELVELPDGMGQNFKSLPCEPGGTANLASVSKIREGNTVLAKIAIHSGSEQVKQLEFGYSDRVRVYLNGRILYSGQHNYMSRDYRYLGTVGYFDSVYLPLKEGNNILVMAVSESFGGWGIKARFSNIEGIEIR